MDLAFYWQSFFHSWENEVGGKKREWQEVTETSKGIWQGNFLPSLFVSSLNTWITVFANKSVCTDEWELEFVPLHLQKLGPAPQGRTQGRFLELRLSCTQASSFLSSKSHERLPPSGVFHHGIRKPARPLVHEEPPQSQHWCPFLPHFSSHLFPKHSTGTQSKTLDGAKRQAHSLIEIKQCVARNISYLLTLLYGKAGAKQSYMLVQHL